MVIKTPIKPKLFIYYIIKNSEKRDDAVTRVQTIIRTATSSASHIPKAIQQSVSPAASISPTPSNTSSTAGGTTTTSRIPIRSMNAEKRARLSGEFTPEIDETKLSPSEVRALK